MNIEGGEQSIGFVLATHFHILRLILVVEEQDPFADQGNGRFIESAVEGDGAVVAHPAPGMLAKMVSELLWGGSEAFHVGSEAFKRALSGGGMFSVVICLIEPQIESLVELIKGVAPKPGQELSSYGAKKSFDFSAALRLAGSAMHQGNAQRGGDVLKVL
jgi:hypothetical protein